MLMPTTAAASCASIGREQSARSSETDDDEGELAALRQQDRDLGGNGSAHAEHAARRKQDHGLDCEQRGDRDENEADSIPDRANIDRHSDGSEEQADQQTLERSEVDLDLVAVLGLRQQQTGQECTQRRREAGKCRSRPPTPTTMNSVIAMISSRLPVRAADRKIGCSTKRPAPMMATTITPACSSALTSASATLSGLRARESPRRAGPERP